MASKNRNGSTDPHDEASTWRAVGAAWRQLFGSFKELGVSFEWHDFSSAAEIDWGATFHPGGLELCLNLSGSGEVRAEGAVAEYESGTVGFYRRGNSPLEGIRKPGDPHQFITVELSPSFLTRHLATFAEQLHPVVREIVQGVGRASAISVPEPLNQRQRDLVNTLRQPPVLTPAQAVWYQAKAIELMGEYFFAPPDQAELFCHRHQRVSRDRIDRVKAILKRDLVNPPALEQLAKEAACSPFYLSRTFSKETGQTIPQYIRQMRMDRAAELLKTGRYNVTEVALEIGYSSLSHFSAAFHQTFGCCPGLYPMSTPTQKAART
ncbi:MAG TPA: AraC family transcriptional regulator [Candidatus Limnocylindria bacterium]|nr:AraC family transcriptional regulator [Candidatus Limnocylindria bacterium]